jgi:hypothetical protein
MPIQGPMARTSSFGDRRSKLAFDRVDEDAALTDRTLGLSSGFDSAADEFQSVTWVYDLKSDVVIWSSPIEELFGFA